jgi:hypothetical protein
LDIGLEVWGLGFGLQINVVLMLYLKFGGSDSGTGVEVGGLTSQSQVSYLPVSFDVGRLRLDVRLGTSGV